MVACATRAGIFSTAAKLTGCAVAQGSRTEQGAYAPVLLCSAGCYLAFLPRACVSALPAAVFAALLVRPSRNTLDADFAAFGEVVSWGAFACVSALAAAVFTVLLVDVRRALEAARAALLLVVFGLS